MLIYERTIFGPTLGVVAQYKGRTTVPEEYIHFSGEKVQHTEHATETDAM